MAMEIASGAGGGAQQMLAGLIGRSPIMPTAGAPALRPVPGSSQTQNSFYDLLAQGDKDAEGVARKRFKHVRESSLDGRELIESGWWQKLLYLNGRQWIYHNARQGWQDKRLARWIPRPVTNICADTIQTIRSMLTGIDITARSRPLGPDPIDTLTAKTVDDIEPALKEEHELQEVFFEADFWAPVLGTVWLQVYWDRDNPVNKEFVQAMACPKCGYQAHPLDLEDGIVPGCPQCGMPGDTFQAAVDDQNAPIGELATVGKGTTDVVSPLEMLVPMYFQRWKDCTELIRLRWRPKSYYDGRPYANQINFRSMPADRSLQMYRSLATMTDLTTAPLQGSGTTSSRMEGTIEAELWVKASPEFPQGLWMRTVGGTQGDTLIIRDEERGIMPGPIPFADIHGQALWPWVYYPYEQRGGKLFAISALDPLIQKQDQINRNDSMVELIMQRMSNPIWLEPKGAEVQRFTGEPGLIVRYSIVAGSNAKPERLEGMQVQQSFFALRAQYFADAEKAAGTQDVLKGATPAGVSAFSSLNLLVERSQSRFTSLFKARGRAYREWLKLALELERVHGPQTRVRTIIGKNNTYTFKTFQKANLKGAFEIIIEDGSEQPKTALGKRAALQQAKDLGFINLEDPDTIYKGLDLLGISDIAPAMSTHTIAAQTEHHMYEQWVGTGRTGPNPMKVESWHNHKIHIVTFDIWANSDRIRALSLADPLVENELMVHRVQHNIGLLNPFGLPIPANMPPPAPLGPDGQPVPGGPVGPGAPAAPGPVGPGGMPPPAEGAGRAMTNSNQESNAIDTLPGAAPGGGNMAGPA
jgi:ssDNA-binding Zn-finger/Zn-ribbon topoisomerase 1